MKRKRFQRSGVPTYWIVDVDEELVEEWTPDATAARIVSTRLVWSPEEGVPALEIDLPAYFRTVRQSW